MHIQIIDQASGQIDTICINRDTQSAIILKASDIDKAEQLLSIAGEMRVGRVTLIASTEAVEALQEKGWVVRYDLVVATKDVGRKGDMRGEITVCKV